MIKSFTNEYEFLSNFYPCKIEYSGLIFLSVESAYQSQKTEDASIQKTFCPLTPMQSKKLGRKVILRSDWELIKLNLMYMLVLQKFTNNITLKEKLLNTGNMEIIEGNYWNDVYWGVCNGIGENLLGKILMKVRDEI